MGYENDLCCVCCVSKCATEKKKDSNLSDVLKKALLYGIRFYISDASHAGCPELVNNSIEIKSLLRSCKWQQSTNKLVFDWLYRELFDNGEFLEQKIPSEYDSVPIVFNISDKESSRDYPEMENILQMNYICNKCEKLIKRFAMHERQCQSLASQIVNALMKPYMNSHKAEKINYESNQPQNHVCNSSLQESIALKKSTVIRTEDLNESIGSSGKNPVALPSVKRKRGRPKKHRGETLKKKYVKSDSTRSKCPFCSKMYSIQHSFVHNCLNYRNRLHCKQCNIFSSTYVRFEKHLEDFHSHKKVRHCDVLNCNQKFISEPAFIWHSHFHIVEENSNHIDYLESATDSENPVTGEMVETSDDNVQNILTSDKPHLQQHCNSSDMNPPIVMSHSQKIMTHFDEPDYQSSVTGNMTFSGSVCGKCSLEFSDLEVYKAHEVNCINDSEEKLVSATSQNVSPDLVAHTVLIGDLPADKRTTSAESKSELISQGTCMSNKEFPSLKGTGLELLCNFCQVLLRNKSELEEHLVSHAITSRDTCIECRITFTNRSVLLDHIQNCHAEPINGPKCYCNYDVIPITESEQHKQNCYYQKCFNCVMCQSKFPTQKRLMIHLVQHPLNCFNKYQEVFPCMNCSEKFYSIPSLKRHCQIQHGNIASGHFIWPNSIENLSNNSGFSKHIFLEHKVGDKEYQCPVCDKSFIIIQELVSHLNNHSSEETCKCSICSIKIKIKVESDVERNQNFNSASSIPVVNSIMNWYCPVCEVMFVSSSALKNHICKSVPLPSIKNCLGQSHHPSPSNELPQLAVRDSSLHIVDGKRVVSSNACSSSLVLHTEESVNNCHPLLVGSAAATTASSSYHDTGSSSRQQHLCSRCGQIVMGVEAAAVHVHACQPLPDEVMVAFADAPSDDSFVPSTENLSVVKALEGSGGNITLTPIEHLIGSVDDMDYFT